MQLKTMNKYGFTAACSVLVSLAVLNGCSSSGSGSVDETKNAETVAGQAIDGYIVGGSYYCFSEAELGTEVEVSGTTGLAGAYSCDSTDVLVTVSGGKDVGYDAQADGSAEGTPSFTGVLKGPSDAGFVTPISTLAVALASVNGTYTPSMLANAVATVKTALGLTEDNILSVNPATNTAYAKKNLQIATIVSRITSSTAGSEAAFAALATELSQRNSVDLTDAETVSSLITAVYASLPDDQKSAQTSDALSTVIDSVVITNNQIDDAEDVSELNGEIVETVEKVRSDYALVIEKQVDAVVVNYADDSSESYDMVNYITPDKNNNGKHQILLNKGITSLDFLEKAVSVENSFTDQLINIGVKVESDSDGREIVVIGRGAKISAIKGDSESIELTIPDDMAWKASAVGADGTKAYTKLTKSGDRVFSSSRDGLRINFQAIADRLEDVSSPAQTSQQFLNISEETGDFKITVIVDGLDVGKFVEDNSTLYSAWGYRMNVNDVHGNLKDSLYATGWEGYFTVE